MFRLSTMYTELFQTLGMAKNEAEIYETLVKEGELGVGAISQKSGIHRRNVYDTLNRLLEKGLVFEILESKENRYQAVHPNKLAEFIQEKQQAIASAMPDLEKMFNTTPAKESVYIYKGIEGWKNNIRDILRIGQDVYVIGAKGAWSDPRLRSTVEQATKEFTKKNMQLYVIYEHQALQEVDLNISLLNKNNNLHYKIMPEKYPTSVGIEIFGDRTVLLSNIGFSHIDEHASLTVVINQQIADAFRTWFQLMWDVSEENETTLSV